MKARLCRGVLRLMPNSATHCQLQPRRLKHTPYCIVHVIVDFQKSPNSEHAEAVCLIAITPLMARRLKWKAHWNVLRLQQRWKLPQTVGTALLQRGNCSPCLSMCWQTQLAPRRRLPIRETLITSSFLDPDVEAIGLEDLTWDEPVSAGGEHIL